MNSVTQLLAQIKPGDVSIPQKTLNNGVFTTVLQIVFGIAGAIAVIMIMVASLKYVTSQGNPQETAQAKNTIVYAVVGLVICIAAFSIVTFVVDKF